MKLDFAASNPYMFLDARLPRRTLACYEIKTGNHVLT